MVNTNITNSCATGKWHSKTQQDKKELANYHHASLGSPTKLTLLQAICQGHLTTFPGLNTELISKHLSPTIATGLGNQDQEAKHLRPTKPSTTEVTVNQPDADLAPAAVSHTNIICSMVFSTESFGSYSDQTERFQVISSQGNVYMFVLYHLKQTATQPWRLLH